MRGKGSEGTDTVPEKGKGTSKPDPLKTIATPEASSHKPKGKDSLVLPDKGEKKKEVDGEVRHVPEPSNLKPKGKDVLIFPEKGDKRSRSRGEDKKSVDTPPNKRPSSSSGFLPRTPRDSDDESCEDPQEEIFRLRTLLKKGSKSGNDTSNK